MALLPPLHVAPFFLYFNDLQEVESEITHLIHLSFISYVSNESLVWLNDAEIEKEKKNDAENEKDKQSIEQPPSVSTRENTQQYGMPEAVEEGSETGSKPFSPHRTSVAPPSGKGDKERHLVDRDIRDILEACRPRATGTATASCSVQRVWLFFLLRFSSCRRVAVLCP
jgi:hypothetical protein